MSVSRKTIIIVGSGGREHALAWKLAQSPQVSRVIVAPGNAGMPAEWERWPLDFFRKEQFEAFAQRARDAKVDLVVVGPDNALALGLADTLQSHGVLVFGPQAAAARIEASKSFAKEVMQAAGISTAKYFLAKSAEEASKILKSVPWHAGWVLKADGLALGKGVRVCLSREEALGAIDEVLDHSPELVIEERVVGEELSWMALCDGSRCALLEPARDYKRAGDGDQGPNTGGMGSFSPVPGVPDGFAERMRTEVFEPALCELAKRGTPFSGVLYAGVMADFTTDQFWILEFNARFGDPETQVLMPRIHGDILPWFEACARGDLTSLPASVPFIQESAVYVVGAARGYPDTPEKGKKIEGELNADGIFCAGVAQGANGTRLTQGGRVFGALGMGSDLQSARAKAYEKLSSLSFEGMQFRKDIAGGTL